MGRPRTPTKVLQLRNAFRKHPERLAERANEPQDDRPLGGPPESLDESELARWIELAGDMPWLTRADRAALWAAAKQYAALWRDGGKASDWSVFRGYLSELGGLAGSRSKIKVPGAKAKPANAFGALGA